MEATARGAPTARQEYWRRNLRLMAGLLAVWFTVSYGFGILLVEQLNNIRLGDFELGFWFAQQGSIFTFVALIAIYAWRMDVFDRELGFAENGHSPPAEGPTPTSANDTAEVN
jgi:putative solute:sodium symporter small subunit